MMMPAKGRWTRRERDGPFTGEMFEAEVARNRPHLDQGSLLVKLRTCESDGDNDSDRDI